MVRLLDSDRRHANAQAILRLLRVLMGLGDSPGGVGAVHCDTPLRSRIPADSGSLTMLWRTEIVVSNSSRPTGRTATDLSRLNTSVRPAATWIAEPSGIRATIAATSSVRLATSAPMYPL